jgi:molecular chaperone HscA
VELPGRGGSPLSFVLDRDTFDAWIDPLLKRTGKACRRAMRDAELTPEEIDGVILVGSSNRVPRVRRYVEELFAQAPLGGIDPDLVVAYGAALQAQMLADSSDEVLLLDVLPLSLGIETMGGAVDRILPRNTTIPAGAKATFTTYADNQTGFEIRVVQGERELAKDCRALAQFTLAGIPPMPAGMARLEVHFAVDENSLLTVSATELTTGQEQSVKIEPSYGLDDETVEQMLMDALDLGEEDFEARRLAEARVEAERMLLATSKALTADRAMLSGAEAERIDAAVSELARAVKTATDPSLIQLYMDTLDSATYDFAGRRMNAAIKGAIGGKGVADVADTVSHADGVDAHVARHSGQG